MQINCNVKPQELENFKGSVHSFVYQNLVYKKLGLRWLKNKFCHLLRKYSYIENLRNQKRSGVSVSINMYYYQYYCYYYYYHYYYYYSYYYGYVYLGLVGSSGIFPSCIQQPQVSRTCLIIFAVPSNAAFCKSSIPLFMSNFLTQSFNLFDIDYTT